MPIRLKMNAPMKVASAFCDVGSSIRIFDARGVAFPAAAEKAATMVPSEKVATASMLEARILRMPSTASAPITLSMSSGKNREVCAATSAVATATTP